MTNQLPQGTYLYDISAYFNQLTLPRELQVFSQLAAETWGRVVVDTGEISLKLEKGAGGGLVTAENPLVIPADVPFKLELTGKPVRFNLEYYHEARVTDAEALSGLLSREAAGRR